MMITKRLFPLLVLGVLTLNGASGVRFTHYAGHRNPAIPAVNKTLVSPATSNASRRRSAKRHLRRFISGLARKYQHK